MSLARDVRRCALQVLYQFDAAGSETPQVVRESLAEAPGTPAAHEEGFELGRRAWAMREEADSAVAAITPEWPTHRQPVVDRNILRLAYYEMSSGRCPCKVVINEAVELAKEFSTSKSHLFINGVLDRIYKTCFRDREAAARDASPGGAG
jgi:N utilization substance protein B